MSPKQSKFRLWYYVSSAMLTVFAGGILTVDFSDWRYVALFIAAIISAGLTGARAYEDQSAGQVVQDIKQTIDFTKFPPLP